ncbi:MAG: agmatine deiminase family protein [Bacteroidales bacterium]|nr:agmatine deiminase family protein [Candidatus Colimorpha merdihippi]
MKKILLSLAALVMTFCAMAQNIDNDSQMMKQWRQMKHKRDITGLAAKSSIPLSTTPAVAPKSSQSLPDDRVWFPGEWEEVQAVVVTPFYSYVPDTNLGNGNFMADPLVTGYADYYKYTVRGWQSMNITGPYKAIMDTTSTFGKVFFSLMDGIQLGHAQAWVRIEHAADSAIVLRTLARLNLRHDNVRFIVGPGNSFWYRDCGPICFYYGNQDSVAMLDFEYYPGRALDDSLPSLITRQTGIPNYINTIEWEGGNCLVDGAGLLFTSDQVYSNNADRYGQLTWDGRNPNTINYSSKTPLSQSQTRQALHDLLGQRETHILPTYQYDGGTGHIDLYADMCEENGFVFSVMPDIYSRWTDYQTGVRNMDSLCSYTSIFDRNYYRTSIPFPGKEYGASFASQNEYNDYYTRTYSNHTFVNDVILQPCFSPLAANGLPSQPWDRQNIEAIQAAYPGYTIYPINVSEFDGSGGAIHCITKQIPADNPVRILHKSIVGSANAMRGQDIPVSAIITNRSGIANAECIYRINGGDWNTVSLNPNGNKFSATLPTAGINDRFLDTTYQAMSRVDSTLISIDTILIDSVANYIFHYSYDTIHYTDTLITLLDTTVTIEYYISATSQNGKTITKPMTAHQGGYYSFYYNGQLENLDSTQYDFGTTPRPMTDITFVFDARRTELDTSVAPEPLDIQMPIAESNFGQFYPNPATSDANIQIDLGNGGRYRVDIIDNMGRTVHTTSLETAGSIRFTINTSKLTSGIYTVLFSSNNHHITRRLVVK